MKCPSLKVGRWISGAGLFLLIVSVGVACSVKRTVNVSVPAKILQAKTATFDELLALLKTYSDKLSALSSTTLRVSFTSGKVESGKLQEYRSAPGYVLLKRPDSLRLNIQNPLTKTSIIELASTGDEFGLWYPRDNKYFVGRNSAGEFVVEGSENSPVFAARPSHIYEAIIPQTIALDDPRVRVSLEEDQDATAKYYVLSILQDVGQKRLRPLRRLWIERSELGVVKQQTFEEDGSIASLIQYSNFTPVEGLRLPLSIHIERPSDGYVLDMQFKSWRVNPEIPPTAFVLSPPAGAQRVVLKEKPQVPAAKARARTQ
jgi:outer membrane lipoprotein-sorting protein